MSKELSCAGDVSIKGDAHFVTTYVSTSALPTAIKLTDEMRDAVIAAVRDSGQFVEKPTDDEPQMRADMTERINLAVADALANAIRPGGVLYAFLTRT